MWFWCIFERYFLPVCTRVMVVNEFWTQRLTVLLFVTKVLGTCTCTWLKKYLMYLMPSKYCEYLYLYLNLQILKVLVLDSSTSESTWPQPWEVLVILRWLLPVLGSWVPPHTSKSNLGTHWFKNRVYPLNYVYVYVWVLLILGLRVPTPSICVGTSDLRTESTHL